MPPPSSALFMPKKKRVGAVGGLSTPAGGREVKGKGREEAATTGAKAEAREGLRSLGGAGAAVASGSGSGLGSRPTANGSGSAHTSAKAERSTSALPDPLAHRPYKEYAILSAGHDELASSSLSVLRFTSGDPARYLAPGGGYTVLLNRKPADAPPRRVRETAEEREALAQKRRDSPFLLDWRGEVVRGPDGVPIPAPPRAEVADTSLIAPHGGAQAAKMRQQARAKSGRKAFEKSRQVKQRYNDADSPDVQRVNRDKLPLVMEIASAAALAGDEAAADDVERYVSRVERQDGTGYAALVFHAEESNGREPYMEMFPVAGDYRFDKHRTLEALDTDEANKRLENAMAFKVGGSRWSARDRVPVPAASALPAGQPTDRKPPNVKSEASAPIVTSLQARVHALYTAKRDVKPRIKRERFDDDETGRGRSRTRAGLERLEGEDLDFEERNEYQDDEEGFQVGAEEEEQAKELEAKNKLEFDRANKNVGVLDGGSDAEDDEDLFGDKEEESKVARKTKKLLARRGEDEGDSSEEDYVDSDEADDSDDETLPEEGVKQEDGTEPSKPASTASRSDGAGRSPSPSSGTRSPVVPSPDKRNGKAPASRRSETPDVSQGHGHTLLAQRAISPVRSRASTPVGRSRSRDRESGSKLGGSSSSGNSRKRKDPREHNTAPADSPAREMAPNSSKKHRANTDHGTSSSLSPENASYLPEPTPFDPNEPVHRQAPGQAPKHKNRAPKKKPDAQSVDDLPDFPGAISVSAFKAFMRSGPKSLSDVFGHFQKQTKEAPSNNNRLRQLMKLLLVQDGSLYKLKS